jgi:hypothetical protein
MREIHTVACAAALAICVASSALANPPTNSLYAGGVLAGSQSAYITPSLVSSTQGATLRLVMQPDCNLVLYLGWGALWSSGTSGKGLGCEAKMQSDGNFVVYTAQNQPVWASGTQGHPGAYALIQNDGNVVVYLGNQALWDSHTDMSYSQTCQNTSLSGGPNPVLSGSCKDFFGNWQNTSLAISGCTGIVTNVDGALRCVISEDLGFDIISVPSDVTNQGVETKVWRVDRPNVRVQDDPLDQSITFKPGDSISFNAGGCVQTGGLGDTWKRYVDPEGNNADHFYSGTVQISGVIGSPTRIAGVMQHGPWLVPSGLTPQTQTQLFLHLGYQDDDYGDNGYWSHDDGNPVQCSGVGPAWVEITVERNLSGQPISQQTWSSGTKPFDLVWDLNTGVDANGLPLNPIWLPQISKPGTELDFQGTCGSAFPDGYSINQTTLANVCTTDGPTMNVDTGVSLIGFCPANPIHGHLNWGVATFTGALTWQGWSGDAIFWDDGDYNFALTVPDNNALCSGTPDEGPGMHLEFNESEVELLGPLWQQLFLDVQGPSSSDPSGLINGNTAVVTGLLGIDGVHNGGYSELHPVYSMAVLTANKPGTDTLEQTWDFFVKNYGNEGLCSEQDQSWDGESGLYYIEFPWPVDALGHRAQDVSAAAAQAWFWTPTGPMNAPVPELDKDQEPHPTRSYLQVALPGGSGLSGQVTLRYTVPPGFEVVTQSLGLTTRLAPATHISSEAIATAGGKTDDYVDEVKLIPNPVARQRVDALPNPYRTAVRRTVVPVKMNLVMGVKKPPPGPAGRGLLTRARTTVDLIKTKWNADLTRALSGTVPQQPHEAVTPH